MTAALKALEYAKSFSLNITNEEYHKRDELSNSGNNLIIDRTPAHFLEYRTNPPKPTAPMITGTITHTAILESERFLDTHVAMPVCDRRTKAGKDFYEQFLIENHGKTVMDNATYHQVFGMIGAVMAHKSAKEILRKSHNELSFIAELEGVKCRCRPDILREGRLIADLKTTENAGFSAFQASFAEYKYHRQAAFYVDLVSQITGEKYDTFSIVSVEKKPPYAVQVFAIDEASIDKGREEYQRGLAIYRECLLTNKWPAYSDDVVPMNLPSWMF